MADSKAPSLPLGNPESPMIPAQKVAANSHVVRFFEMLPGLLAWTTIALMFVLSRYTPTFVSVFIILFDIYWFLKTFYVFLHVRATFKTMKENMKKDWLTEIKNLGDIAEKRGFGAQDVYHLLLFPMYKEPEKLVRESFASLLKVRYPKDKCIVVLAIEERAGDAARETAQKIQTEFGDKFFKFLVTEHPAGLEGEIPGKGSNEAWAGAEVKRRVIDPLAIPYDRILVSVFDIDTQVYPEYFGRLTHAFLTSENPLRAVYQPVPLFINNIFEAPALARVVSFSASFWQMIQQSRPERLTTFSSQSIPFQTLVDVGFWHKDVVSEDSRIFWQGYLHYHGDFRVVPLAYPVSMDANVAPTFWGTMANIYKQQRRWGWGCENIPYMLEGFREDPKIPARKKWYWSLIGLEGFHSWATNALMILVLGWLPIALGGRSFRYTLLSYSLPHVTRFIVGLSMFGLATSAMLAFLLLPERPEWFGKRHHALYFLEWALMPITLIVFGALPGIEAQTRLMLGGKYRLGFWVTPKGRNLT